MDSYGNSNTALSPDFVINFDDQSLAPVITAVQASDATPVSSGSTIDEALVNVRIDFQENMNAGERLTFAQLTTSNCNIVGGISVDANHRVFTFQAQIPANQTASIDVPAGLLHDLAGNANLASVSAYTARYEPPPVTADRDIILLIDMSGSMDWPVTIEGTNQAKIAFMRPMIIQFLTKLEAAVTAGSAKATDRIGIVQYESAANVVQVAGQNMVTLAQLGDVMTAVNGLATGNNTAIGSGLANALNLLNYSAASARKRHIVMFADGQDNMAPLLTTSPTQYSIPAPAASGTAGYPAGMGAVTVNSTDANRIPIHTIGITTEGYGDTSPWLVKLDNLSTVTSGIRHALPDDQIWPLSSEDLDDVIAAIYDGSSPQPVFRAQGALEAGTESARHAFQLGGGAKGAIVSISWPGNVPMRINLSKDGKKVSGYPYARRIGSCYTCAMKLPFRQRERIRRPVDIESISLAAFKKRPGIDLDSTGIFDIPDWQMPKPVLFEAEGTWEIEVKRLDAGISARAPYEVSVIAEERKLEMKVDLPRGYVFTGYPIDIWLRVTEGGVPVRRIDGAELRVTKPLASLGNVIKRHERELFSHVRERGGKANLEVVMDAVRKLPAAAAELKRFKTTKAAFSASEAGKYLCRIDAPAVPGLYRMDIVVRGQAPGAGAFERRATRTLLVEPSVNWKKSVLKQHFDPKTGIVELVIEPKDDAGNLLGPGFADWIKAEFSEIGSLKIEDNLNGTYDVKAKAKKDGVKPGRPLKLNVMGRAVWKSGREG